MGNSAHQFLAAWENYYVIVGSSAAALTGLQFVVMALVADTPGLGNDETVAAFATPTVFHFCVALFVSAVLAAPWTTLTPVGWLLLGIGIAGVGYTLVGVRRAQRQTAYKPVAEDWIWHTILPFMAYGALAVGALRISHDSEKILFLPAAVVLALVFIGIHNAWDTVAYIATQHRKPNTEGEIRPTLDDKG